MSAGMRGFGVEQAGCARGSLCVAASRAHRDSPDGSAVQYFGGQCSTVGVPTTCVSTVPPQHVLSHHWGLCDFQLAVDQHRHLHTRRHTAGTKGLAAAGNDAAAASRSNKHPMRLMSGQSHIACCFLNPAPACLSKPRTQPAETFTYLGVGGVVTHNTAVQLNKLWRLVVQVHRFELEWDT
jgi:hypothetical protein